MIVRLHRRRECPYAQIERATLADERLSWKARGLLAYCLSLPADAKLTFAGLVDAGPDGRDCLQNILHELSEMGYANLSRIQNKKGHLQGSRWDIYESPDLLKSE